VFAVRLLDKPFKYYDDLVINALCVQRLRNIGHESVFTPKAPTPPGHYAQATIHNGIVYVSGQLPIDPATGEKKLGSVEEQTEQALQNVAAILEAA
jgi:enamine deaminase RidA (YjgF/YER057c/UK114 family)